MLTAREKDSIDIKLIGIICKIDKREPEHTKFLNAVKRINNIKLIN
jgi:hypothetical protein